MYRGNKAASVNNREKRRQLQTDSTKRAKPSHLRSTRLTIGATSRIRTRPRALEPTRRGRFSRICARVAGSRQRAPSATNWRKEGKKWRRRRGRREQQLPLSRRRRVKIFPTTFCHSLFATQKPIQHKRRR